MSKPLSRLYDRARALEIQRRAENGADFTSVFADTIKRCEHCEGPVLSLENSRFCSLACARTSHFQRYNAAKRSAYFSKVGEPFWLEDELIRAIPLTQGDTALVNEDDAQTVLAYRWHSSQGYAATRPPDGGKCIRMHRLILAAEEGMEVDHINGTRSDNRRKNLRLVTHRQNIQHRTRLNKNNASGVRGVTWDKTRNKYQVKFTTNGATHHFGRFDTLDEAAAVAQSAMQQLGFTSAPTVDAVRLGPEQARGLLQDRHPLSQDLAGHAPEALGLCQDCGVELACLVERLQYRCARCFALRFDGEDLPNHHPLEETL